MRLTAMVAMAAVAGWGVEGRLAAGTSRNLTVYLMDGSAVPGPVSVQAKARAAKVFADAGVTLEWRRFDSHSSLSQDAIVIEMKAQTPASFYPGALAFAKPYEGVHITVFYDRIQQMVPAYQVSTLAANVLVHEITHILQAVSRHSDSGIMKAHWDSRDYDRMGHNSLAFEDIDVALIHRGLEARVSTVNSVAPAAE